MSLDGPKKGIGKVKAGESPDAIVALRQMPWAVQPELIRMILTELRDLPPLTLREFVPYVEGWSKDRRVSACTLHQVDLYDSMYKIVFSAETGSASTKTDTKVWRANLRKFLEKQLDILYANGGLPRMNDLTRLRPNEVRLAIMRRYSKPRESQE